MKAFILSLCLFLLGQSLVWVQTNGQFIWDFAKRNPFAMSLLGVPISYIFIKATQYCHTYFGELWPIRMVAFSTGITAFTILTWYLANESFNWRSISCIVLSLIIIY